MPVVQVVDGIAAALASAGRDDPAVVALVAAAGIAAQAQPADSDPADRADADPTSAESATNASEPVFGQLVQTQPTEAVTDQAAPRSPDVWTTEVKLGGQDTGPIVLGKLMRDPVRVPAGHVPHRLRRHNGLPVRLDLLPQTFDLPLSSWLQLSAPVRVRVEERHVADWVNSRYYYWNPPAKSAEDVLVVGVETQGKRAVISVPGLGYVSMDGFALAHVLQFVGALDGHEDGALIFLAAVATVYESGHEQLAASLQASLAELGHVRRVAIGTTPALWNARELVVPDGGHVRIFPVVNQRGAINEEAVVAEQERVAAELAKAYEDGWKYRQPAGSDATEFSLDHREGVLRLMEDATNGIEGLPSAEAVLSAFRTLRRVVRPAIADVLLLAIAQRWYGVTTMADLWSLLASAQVDPADFDGRFTTDVGYDLYVGVGDMVGVRRWGRGGSGGGVDAGEFSGAAADPAMSDGVVDGPVGSQVSSYVDGVGESDVLAG
ncbi:hypothetical protein ABZX92_45885, partial [Lentzea sp. NPDC006480]|uniref:hypothetical protein n=1 Tax=Lentzea sp. NPDC006480 TaxID=3157176 RepID=UPI00339E9831